MFGIVERKLIFTKVLFAVGIIVAGAWIGAAQAADQLVVSVWGGSWKDMVADIVASKFTADTGIEVKFITGGTIDRLNKSKLTRDDPESDLTLTTSHVGWLYATDGLFETLDLTKVPNAVNLVPEAKLSPYHIGVWAYVYAIGYRPDLVRGITFESWTDLWKPEMKGLLAMPDFDPSHVIAVAATLAGADTAHWEKGQAGLMALKPNIKAFYTDDANSQQLIANGETPVQIMLSMNAHYMIREGVPITLVIPKEGGVLGVDSVGIMKGTRHIESAYKFMNTLLDPDIQAKIAAFKKGSPTVTNARLDPETAKLPGVFTTPEQWKSQAMVIDHKLRSEKLGEWRKWFAENIMAN